MKDLPEMLLKAATEIRQEGHAGWGNLCDDAAAAIGALISQNAELHDTVTGVSHERDTWCKAAGEWHDAANQRDMLLAEIERIATVESEECARDPFLCKALANGALDRLARATEAVTAQQVKHE